MKQLVSRLESWRDKMPEGYIAEILAKGTVTNGIIEISYDDVRAIQSKYQPQPIKGLGDVVAKIAQPIARAIDRVAKTDLKNCARCKKTQARLNKSFPIN